MTKAKKIIEPTKQGIDTLLSKASSEKEISRRATMIENTITADSDIVPEVNNREIYKRLLCIATVDPLDYCDADGNFLSLSQLSYPALKAAQMERIDNKLYISPPTQKIQLEAIKILCDILAMKDIVSLAAGAMSKELRISLSTDNKSSGFVLINEESNAA